MTTLNERAERERIRKRAARQGFKLFASDEDVRPYGLLFSNGSTLWFQDLAEVAAELRARAS